MKLLIGSKQMGKTRRVFEGVTQLYPHFFVRFPIPGSKPRGWGWGGTHFRSDGSHVPTSVSKELSVLNISLCKKGGHSGINTSLGGHSVGRGVIEKKGVIGY